MPTETADKQHLQQADTRYITALRFPLAVLVVIIHGSMYTTFLERMSEEPFSCLDAITRVWSQLVPTFAVPLFFAISGYLFFLKSETFTLATYGAKLRRRIRTLFVPYVVWILAYFFIYLLKQRADGSAAGVGFGWNIFWGVRPLGPASTNWLGYAVNETLAPIAVPLWFVRDLICVVILSPLVHFVVRRCGIAALLVLATLYYAHLWPNYGNVSLQGLWYFSLGAWFSLHHRQPRTVARRYSRISMLLLLPLIAVLFIGSETEWLRAPAQMLYVFAAMIAAIGLADRYAKESKTLCRLADSTFFVYASHTLILSPLCTLMAKHTLHSSTGVQIAVYFVLPWVCIPVCVAAHWAVSHCGRWSGALTARWPKS